VEAEAEGVEPLEEPEGSGNWLAKLALSLGAGPEGVGLPVGVRPEEAELLGKPEGSKIWRFSKCRLVGKPDGKPEGIPVGVGAPEETEL
jgi:hypothetical protein